MAEFDLGRAQGEIIIGTDQARRSVDGLASSMNKSISKAGQSMARTGTRLSLGVTLPLVGIGVKAVQTSIEFTKTMNTMAAVAGVPAPALEKLRALSIKMGQDTIFSANDAGQAMLELGKAGVSTADIMGGALKNTLDLATAGDLDLANAATIASNAMNVFGLNGKQSQQAVDALAGAANASSADVSDLAEALAQGGSSAALAGQSIQETAGFLGEMAQAGIKGSDAGTSLKTFMLSLVPTTETAKKAIADLNLEFVNQDGTIKSLGEVSQELQDKVGGLTQAQQQVALKTIFGTDAYRAAAIATKNGAEGLAVYTDAASKAGTASDVAAGKMEGLPGVIETLKGSIDTALLVLGDTLAPIVESVATVFSDLLNAFVSLPQPVKAVIVIIAGLAAAAGPLLFIIGHAITLFSILLGPIGLIVGAIALLVGGFIALNGGLGQTVKHLSDFFSNLGKALAPAIGAIKKMVIDVGKAFAPLLHIFDGFGPEAGKKAKGALNIVTDAINNFAKGLAVVVPAVARGLVAVILWLIKNVPKAARVVSDAFNALMEAAQPVFDFIKKQGIEIWNALVDVWNNDLKPALADLQPLFEDLKSIFIDLWPAIQIVGKLLLFLMIVPLLALLKILPGVIRAVGGLIRGFVKVERVITAFAKIVIHAISVTLGAIIRFVGAASRQFGTFVRFVGRIPSNVIGFFQDMYNGVKDWVGKAVEWIVDKWNGIVNFFRGIGKRLANAGRGMWDWIVQGAKAVGNAAIRIVNGMIGAINKFHISIHEGLGPLPDINVDWAGPQIPTIPMLATGIHNFPGGLAIVGENGPELVNLDRGSDILPNKILRSLQRNMTTKGLNKIGVGAAQPSLRGLEVVGVVDTPFGPAQIRGLVRDEIESNDAWNRSRSRMVRVNDDD